MSVVEASSGTYRSRVDGTIVLSVEIEPRFRAEALALFGMPGTPMALAALKVLRSVPKPEVRTPIGQYCWQAIDLCRDPRFREWVAFATLQGTLLTDESGARAYILEICGIGSRKDLDVDHEARGRFTARLFRPFNEWLEARLK